MSDLISEKNYQAHLKKRSQQWEELCIRCGGCCGAYDDPCRHLKKDKELNFYCSIYDRRLGARKTVANDDFDCVFVKEILNTYWPNDHLCIYKKYLKTPWLIKNYT